MVPWWFRYHQNGWILMLKYQKRSLVPIKWFQDSTQIEHINIHKPHVLPVADLRPPSPSPFLAGRLGWCNRGPFLRPRPGGRISLRGLKTGFVGKATTPGFMVLNHLNCVFGSGKTWWYSERAFQISWAHSEKQDTLSDSISTLMYFNLALEIGPVKIVSFPSRHGVFP